MKWRIGFVLAVLLVAARAAADDHAVALGDYQVQVSQDWERREPASRILSAEFATPPAEGDETAGRFTVSSAGGGVEANLDRWIGQFSQPDGKPTRERAKTEKKTVAGQEVHLLDVSGTYKDQPRGPMGPVVDREDYRMLAAIVVTDGGQFFLKLYGPRRTIAAQEQAFRRMIDSLAAR